MKYKVGTDDRDPARCRCTADEIAAEAEFFSFGTNDLTQMTFGFSARRRRPSSSTHYYDNKIYGERSVRPARSERRRHAGADGRASWAARPVRTSSWASAANTAAIRPPCEFCHKVGLNYVSCSPFRVPIARLAAAHAAIKEKMGQL